MSIVLIFLALTGVALAIWGRFFFSLLGWLYLLRIPLLGLIALAGLPLAAQGPARSLALGAFDLHSVSASFFVGLLLPISGWVIFLTAALIFLYGTRRTGFDIQAPPPWLLFAFRICIGIAWVLNVWTILWASVDVQGSGPDLRLLVRTPMMLGLAVGFSIGLAIVWCGEWVHCKHRAGGVEKRLYFLLRPAADGMRSPGNELTGKWAWLLRGYGEFDTKGNLVGLPGHRLVLVGTAISVLIYAYIYFVDLHTERAALLYLLLLQVLAVLVLAGATFFLDAYRLPVLIVLGVWMYIAANIPETDHFYRVWPKTSRRPIRVELLPDRRSASFNPMTPEEVLEAADKSGHPVVLVAAAGGGIQAAAWAVTVLTGIERETRAAGTKNDFAGSIQCISGVSGGASGAMFFVNGYGARGLPPPRPSGIPSNSLDADHFAKLLDDLAEEAKATSLGSTVWGLAYPDLRRMLFPFFIQNVYRDRAFAMEYAWMRNAQMHLAEEETENSITPDDKLGWSLVEWKRDVRSGIRPATILNATVGETGDRLQFSTAPPSENYQGQREFITRREDQSNDESLCPGADLHLVTAARLSATFPLISPSARAVLAADTTSLVKLTEDGRTKGSFSTPVSKGAGLLHLVDGGYYDNSGLGALAQWLDDGLTDLSKKPAKKLPSKILVIQIDGFPSQTDDGDASQAKPAEQTPPADGPSDAQAGGPPSKAEEDMQKGDHRGTFFQIVAPLIALYDVRGAGHTAYVNRVFQMLVQRWKLVPADGSQPSATTKILFVKFNMPRYVTKAAGKPGWFPDWALASPDKPPLSWHPGTGQRRGDGIGIKVGFVG